MPSSAGTKPTRIRCSETLDHRAPGTKLWDGWLRADVRFLSGIVPHRNEQ